MLLFRAINGDMDCPDSQYAWIATGPKGKYYAIVRSSRKEIYFQH